MSMIEQKLNCNAHDHYGKLPDMSFVVLRLISAVCSTKLPGPGAVYISQEMKFLAPGMQRFYNCLFREQLSFDGYK